MSKDSEELINDYISNLKIRKFTEEDYLNEVSSIFKNEQKNRTENFGKNVLGYKEHITNLFFSKFIVSSETEVYYKSTIQYMTEAKRVMSSELFAADSNTNLYLIYSLLFLCKKRLSQKDLFKAMKNLAFSYFSLLNYAEKENIDETFYIKSENEYLIRHVIFKKTIIFYMSFISSCVLNSICIYYKDVIKDDFYDVWNGIFSENNKKSVIIKMFSKYDKLYIDFLQFITSDFIMFTSHDEYRMRMKEIELSKE